MNLCTVCGQDFGSVGAFDAHRVGAYEYTFSADHPDGRRCLTAEELTDGNWTRDGRGRWRRAGDGAPWRRSQNQVRTESLREQRAKPPGHLRRARPSTRLPEPQKGLRA
jgi:hypothetical protein